MYCGMDAKGTRLGQDTGINARKTVVKDVWKGSGGSYGSGSHDPHLAYPMNNVHPPLTCVRRWRRRFVLVAEG